MIEMYLRLFLTQMRKGFVNLTLGWVSQPCPRLHIFRVILKSKRGMIEVPAACSAWTKRALGITAFSGSGYRTRHRHQGGAAWGSPSKTPSETWVASFLCGKWNVDSVISPPPMAKEKVMQLCNPFNSNTLPWVTMASHSSDPWWGSPEIRHVPIERIWSEAVYAPIKNKEWIVSNNGRENPSAIPIHSGFSAIYIHLKQ